MKAFGLNVDSLREIVLRNPRLPIRMDGYFFTGVI